MINISMIYKIQKPSVGKLVVIYQLKHYSFYKSLGPDLSAQSCLYFQGF